ncbi:MAG: hypothetical protein QG610_642 [Euryarchaeota archaeon]|nr:hypothetical protein [Euryarchaeota archaeon]
MNQQQKIKIELTLDQLRTLQSLLRLADALKSISLVTGSLGLSDIETEINALIGDATTMYDREKSEKFIREYYKDKHKNLSIALKNHAERYPLPEAFRKN